jgi:3-oxoacyl-[acyl-carrier protein] reductase
VVLCASITALAATRGRMMYGPAKAAMTGLVRALAVELAPAVRVNGLLPGIFDTEMTAGLHADPSALSALRARIPLGRTGDAEEFGALAAFLAADAGYVTGTLLPIDGGLLARSPVPSGDPPA